MCGKNMAKIFTFEKVDPVDAMWIFFITAVQFWRFSEFMYPYIFLVSSLFTNSYSLSFQSNLSPTSNPVDDVHLHNVLMSMHTEFEEYGWIFTPQDPLETVREKCEQTEHCVHTRERLEACETRVGSRSETTEDCTEELFDFLHARDHCVSADAQTNLWMLDVREVYILPRCWCLVYRCGLKSHT